MRITKAQWRMWHDDASTLEILEASEDVEDFLWECALKISDWESAFSLEGSGESVIECEALAEDAIAALFARGLESVGTKDVISFVLL